MANYGSMKKNEAKSRKPLTIRTSGRPREKDVSLRLDKILGIAAQVFLDEGFDRASVSAIARLAGASKETLYARFATKEELFETVITRKTEILLKKFSRVLVSDQRIEKVLEVYGLNLLNLMLGPEMQRLSRTVVSAAPHFPELAERFWKLCPDREQQQLAEYLKAMISSEKSSTRVVPDSDPLTQDHALRKQRALSPCQVARQASSH